MQHLVQGTAGEQLDLPDARLDQLLLLEFFDGDRIALVKGVLAKMKQLGYRIGGFTAALRSDLPSGSGLSSSAAVEALLIQIVDVLYNNNGMPTMDKALVAQYAENEYFGKPCGLLDQIGASFGGVSALLSMLNSCAAGVSVVNIDNGFGAGFLAARIDHIGAKEKP